MAVLPEHPGETSDVQAARVLPRALNLSAKCGAARAIASDPARKARHMETYPADVDPEQLVRWVIAERRAAQGAAVSAVARRTTEVREIPMRREVHLGDQEREDLSEIATVATLEIAPVEPGKGWLLTVLIEDEAGPRAPNEDNAFGEGEEEIDLDAFYDEFIRPGRGNAYIVAEVESAAAKGRVTRLLTRIERNLHRSEHGVARR